jgi:hypothetical protein
MGYRPSSPPPHAGEGDREAVEGALCVGRAPSVTALRAATPPPQAGEEI